jgi:diphthine synthase
LGAIDIKVKEQSDDNLARGRKIYEPPRFMSCQQAAQQLLEAIQNNPQPSGASAPEEPTTEGKSVPPAVGLLTRSSQVVCVARVGAADQRIVACSLEEAATLDMGKPLHSLVIPGMSSVIVASLMWTTSTGISANEDWYGYGTVTYFTTALQIYRVLIVFFFIY